MKIIFKKAERIFPYLLLIMTISCLQSNKESSLASTIPEPDFIVTSDKNHNKFSRNIPFAIKVNDGSVIDAYTHEATGGQLNINSTLEDFQKVDINRIHTLTGPIYIEGAEIGDVLAIELLEIEPGDWGWTGIIKEIGFLTNENQKPGFKTYSLDKKNNMIQFSEGINIPMKPFAGVMGVAPNTDEMLVTFPPRANGGNLDDPNIVAGSTVYFPIFVKGALFSIGDTHAAQGMGEVAGTAVEAPMRIRFRVKVIKGLLIEEPQYETKDYYATTGFGTTIDEAARKATDYMVNHIVKTYDISWEEAYMLCSVAGDLKIAEVVDLPNMLVAMHLSKDIFDTNQD